MVRLYAVAGASVALLAAGSMAQADHVHATWTANPASIREGEQTRFTLTLRSSPDAGKFQATSFHFDAGTPNAAPSTSTLNLTGNTASPATLSVDTTYYEDGNYTARIDGSGLISKVEGNKTSYSDYQVHLQTGINVTNVQPNLQTFTVPIVIDQNLGFNFSATAFDPGDTLLYQWDFNNDGIIDATGQNPFFAYSQSGTYTGRLVVSDDDSFTFANFMVQVNDVVTPPAAVPLPPAVLGAGALLGVVGVSRKLRYGSTKVD